jgi:hypothetical protein
MQDHSTFWKTATGSFCFFAPGALSLWYGFVTNTAKTSMFWPMMWR